jgi:predicted amidohydrolase YtcJ
MLWAERRVGAMRAKTSYCWKTFLVTGVHTAGGSDCPVEPVEPMKGIYAAVTRKDMEGLPHGGWMPEQKLTVEEAIRLFAQGGPYAAFEERLKGSLECGKMADMVVLDQDPFEVEPDALKDIKPVLTIIGGSIAYDGR